MKSRTPRYPLITAGVLAVTLATSACDPRQALGPDTPKGGPRAIAGEVYNSATGAPLADARVEIDGIGTASTDGAGRYQMGNQEDVGNVSELALHVEAPGYGSVSRLVEFESNVIQMPRLYLTPLVAATVIGPEGGEYTFPNGVKVQAEGGVLGDRVSVGVTILAAGASGRVGDPAGGGMTGTFHVSPAGTRFSRPLRISIPLAGRAEPLSKVYLYRFDRGTRRWVLRSGGTIDTSGLHAEIEVIEGETYAYTTQKNWASRQTAEPVVKEVIEAWVTTDCIPVGETYYLPSFTYNKQFSTTVSSSKYPGLVAYLHGEYGGDHSIPSRTLGPYAEETKLVIYKTWLTEQRFGEAWLLADPAHKDPYEWHHKRWFTWFVARSDCQGLVVVSGG
jgi:hypothetical protein